MPLCPVHRTMYTSAVCPTCELASALARRQPGYVAPQVANPNAPLPNTLPAGAALGVQARFGQNQFAALNPANTLYIPRGVQVDFKAVATGGNAAALNMVNFSTTAWAGTGGANGAGATKSVTFNNASVSKAAPVTITATFAGQTVTINCVVYTVTVTSTPADNFAGRSTTDLGVDERTALTIQTVPALITPQEAGGLQWSVARSGRENDGKVQRSANVSSEAADDGTAYYIAPYQTGAGLPPPATKAVQLQLKVRTGPLAGAVAGTRDFTIQSPVAHMKPVAGSRKHTQNSPSAGFLGNVYLFPKNVSFRTLKWREAGGKAVSTGTMAHWNGLAHHATTFTGQEREVDNGNNATGCYVKQVDQVFSGIPPFVLAGGANDATEVGKYTWPIYWQYRPADQTQMAWIRFHTAHHVATMYQTGRMVMYKGCDPVLNCAECTATANEPYAAGTFASF